MVRYGVFLAVDDVLLQGGIELAEINGDRVRAPGGIGRHDERRFHGADLQALEIIRAFDRVNVVRDGLEAVAVERAAADADIGKTSHDLLAELSVHDLIQRILIREQEGHVQNVHGLVEAAEFRRRQERCLDGAHLHAFDHFLRRAELLGRIDLDLDAAVGLLFDHPLELQRRELVGRGRVGVVCKLQRIGRAVRSGGVRLLSRGRLCGGFCRCSLISAAGQNGRQHDTCKQQCKDFLHSTSSSMSFFRLISMVSIYENRTVWRRQLPACAMLCQCLISA